MESFFVFSLFLVRLQILIIPLSLLPISILFPVNQNTYTNKVRLCVRYRLLYIQGVVETKKFSGPNSHIYPHSDIGAVNQMDLRKKEEKINATDQGNGTEQRKGPIRSQQFREEQKKDWAVLENHMTSFVQSIEKMLNKSNWPWG